jgi:RNA polymerase sigma factor (sigma-70 family)
MGAERNSDEALSLPAKLRNLLEAAEGSAREQAWTEFLDSYSRLILFVAHRTPGDYDVVMDRYAFVVERLGELNYRRLRTYAADGRGKFTTWLMVVARRLCVDHDRLKHGRSPEHEGRDRAHHSRLLEVVLTPEAMEHLPDRGASADEELDRKQFLERLDAAVANLTSSDQLLLALRYRDDRSAREIASLMKLPTPFHVYRRLSRVHASLRQALTSLPSQEQSTKRAAPEIPAVQYRWSK